MDTDLRNLRHGGRPNPSFPSNPRHFLLIPLHPLPPLLQPNLLLLRITRTPCRSRPLRGRIHRLRHGHLRRLPLLCRRQHVLLLRRSPLGHGPAHGQRGQRLVNSEVRPRRRLRPRHPPQRRRHAAEKGGKLGARRGAGPPEDHGFHTPHRRDRGGAGVRDVPRRRRASAAVLRQLLRRGGVGSVRAQGGEGVRATDCRCRRGEDEGVGGGGEGVEARWGRSGVGPGTRAGVRAETPGIENGGHQGLRARYRLHG